MRIFLGAKRIGTRTINGTEWPVIDQAYRTGKREYTVTRGLCNGVPHSTETYQTMRQAIAALHRIEEI